jgi:Enoyl-CoA hydratase/isomerase
MSDNPFHAATWSPVDGFADLTDITYHRHITEPTVRVAFNRPEVRNAFRPHTVDELYRALDHARMSPDVGVVLLTGNGPSPKDGGWAFCSGGDQRIRGRSGYQYASGDTADTVDVARAGRLHILEVQRLIRFMPKVVICLVNGWAAGGGHSLHSTCDLTLASRQLQADRCRRRQFRRQLRQLVFGSPGRTEVRPRDLVPGPALHSRACTTWARSTTSSTTPSWRPWDCSGRARSTRNRLRRKGC